MYTYIKLIDTCMATISGCKYIKIRKLQFEFEYLVAQC